MIVEYEKAIFEYLRGAIPEVQRLMYADEEDLLYIQGDLNLNSAYFSRQTSDWPLPKLIRVQCDIGEKDDPIRGDIRVIDYYLRTIDYTATFIVEKEVDAQRLANKLRFYFSDIPYVIAHYDLGEELEPLNHQEFKIQLTGIRTETIRSHKNDKGAWRHITVTWRSWVPMRRGPTLTKKLYRGFILAVNGTVVFARPEDLMPSPEEIVHYTIAYINRTCQKVYTSMGINILDLPNYPNSYLLPKYHTSQTFGREFLVVEDSAPNGMTINYIYSFDIQSGTPNIQSLYDINNNQFVYTGAYEIKVLAHGSSTYLVCTQYMDDNTEDFSSVWSINGQIVEKVFDVDDDVYNIIKVVYNNQVYFATGSSYFFRLYTNTPGYIDNIYDVATDGIIPDVLIIYSRGAGTYLSRVKGGQLYEGEKIPLEDSATVTSDEAWLTQIDNTVVLMSIQSDLYDGLYKVLGSDQGNDTWSLGLEKLEDFKLSTRDIITYNGYTYYGTKNGIYKGVTLQSGATHLGQTTGLIIDTMTLINKGSYCELWAGAHDEQNGIPDRILVIAINLSTEAIRVISMDGNGDEIPEFISYIGQADNKPYPTTRDNYDNITYEVVEVYSASGEAIPLEIQVDGSDGYSDIVSVLNNTYTSNITQEEYTKYTITDVLARVEEIVRAYKGSHPGIYSEFNTPVITDTITCTFTEYTLSWSNYLCRMLYGRLHPTNKGDGMFINSIMDFNLCTYFSSGDDNGLWYIDWFDDPSGTVKQTGKTDGTFNLLSKSTYTPETLPVLLLAETNSGIWYLDASGQIHQTNLTSGSFTFIAANIYTNTFIGSVGSGIYYVDFDDGGLIKQTNQNFGTFTCGSISSTGITFFGSIERVNGVYLHYYDAIDKQVKSVTGGPDYYISFIEAIDTPAGQFIFIGTGPTLYISSGITGGVINLTTLALGSFIGVIMHPNTHDLYFFGNQEVWHQRFDSATTTYETITRIFTVSDWIQKAIWSGDHLYFMSDTALYYLDDDGQIINTWIESPGQDLYRGFETCPNGKFYLYGDFGIYYLKLGGLSGESFAKELELITINHGTETGREAFNIMEAFGPTGALTENAYRMLPPAQVVDRSQDFLDYVETLKGLRNVPRTNNVVNNTDVACSGAPYTAKQSNITTGRFLSMGMGQDGRLYFGAHPHYPPTTGIYVLDNDGIIKQTNITTGGFHFTVLGQDGKAYFGSNNGIYFLDDDGIIKQTNKTNAHVHAAAIGQDGRLYYCTSSSNEGIYVLDNDGIIKQTNKTDGGYNFAILGQDNKLYFGSNHDGIWYLDDDGDIKRTVIESGSYNCAAIGQDGKLYFGSGNDENDGILRLDDDGDINYTNKADGSFYCMVLGGDNKLYFGSSSIGIWYLDALGQVQQAGISAGLHIIYCMASGSDGRLYFGDASNGIGYIDDSGNMQQTNKTDGRFSCAAIGQDGKLYFGCFIDSGGIWYLD